MGWVYRLREKEQQFTANNINFEYKNVYYNTTTIPNSNNNDSNDVDKYVVFFEILHVSCHFQGSLLFTLLLLFIRSAVQEKRRV